MAGPPKTRSSGTSSGDRILLLGGLVSLLAVLIVAPLDPAVKHSFTRVPGPTPGSGDLDDPAYSRTTVDFQVEGTRVEAWLYIPKPTAASPGLPPVVIMAHGLGAQRDFGLHAYAHEFASGGLAVLVFDYRTFGGSDGEPRHWVSPMRHLMDWVYAVNWVADTNADGQVDGSRLVLWGTSFSGGHVLVTAARLRNGPRIAAIVAQVPHLSGKASSKNSLKRRGVLGSLRMVYAALHDSARGLMKWSPGYVQLAGLSSDVAFMQMAPAEFESYKAKHPKSKLGGWQNLALARLALEMPGYSPIELLPAVRPPVLFVAAALDTLCPIELVREAAASMGNRSSLHEYNTTHFDLYLEKGNFALSVGRQVAFYRKHLGMPPLPRPVPTPQAAVVAPEQIAE